MGFTEITRDLKTYARASRGSLRELGHYVAAMRVLLRQVQERAGRATEDEMLMMEEELQQMSDIVESLSDSSS